MTDTRHHVDLDEYSQLLTDLEAEIRAYGNQRKSLEDMVNALKGLNASSSSAIDRAEKTILTGESLFTKLDELQLPDQIARLRSRYEKHQQSLTDVTEKMQHIVQEQQRASLESLQNAQHTRESLERSDKEARTTAEAQDGRIAGVSEQVSVLSAHVSDHVGELLTALRTQAESLADVQRQLNVTRTVAVLTLVVLVLFAVLVASNVI